MNTLRFGLILSISMASVAGCGLETPATEIEPSAAAAIPVEKEPASAGESDAKAALSADTRDPSSSENIARPIGEESFSGNWNYSWGDTKTSSADIGTSVGRTCFLTGIGGHMRPLGAYLFSGGTYPAMAGVRKKPSGNYELYVQPESGRHLIAFARCVNSAAGRIEVGSSTGEQSVSGDKVLGAVNGTRQCFLQDIKNFPVALKDGSGATYSYSWAFDDVANSDEVRIINDGSFLKLRLKPGAHSYPVNFHATAVCLDASESFGPYEAAAANGSTAQINLTSVSGATCGLLGVKGHIDATLGDWNDAVSISQVGSQFNLNLANGKRGYAACMK